MKKVSLLLLSIIMSIGSLSIAHAQEPRTPTPSATAAPSLSLLRELITSPDCETSCWLGIEIGLREDELAKVLETNHLQYRVQEIGGTGDAFSYDVIEGYSHPFVNPSASSVIVWVGHQLDLEDSMHVGGIDIQLSHVSVNDIIKEFGAPTHILQDRDYKTGLMELLYIEQGLVFTAAYDDVWQVGIRPDSHLLEAYVASPFSESLNSCSTDLQICSAATATPTPGFTPTATSQRP